MEVYLDETPWTVPEIRRQYHHVPLRAHCLATDSVSRNFLIGQKGCPQTQVRQVIAVSSWLVSLNQKGCLQTQVRQVIGVSSWLVSLNQKGCPQTQVRWVIGVSSWLVDRRLWPVSRLQFMALHRKSAATRNNTGKIQYCRVNQ